MNCISMLAIMAWVVLSLVCGAQAADNKIRVVQPDGSVQEFEIPSGQLPPPAPEAEAAPVAPVEKEEAAPIVEKPKKPETAEPGPVRKVVKAEPEVEPRVEPKAKPMPVVKRADVPRPPRKPVLQASAATEPLPVDQVDRAAEISRETAIAVALSEAPPARSMNVSRRNFEGREVFVVSFITDDGAFDVLVDRVSGEIIHSEESDGPRGPYIPQPRRAE